jgi:hypothetical protein
MLYYTRQVSYYRGKLISIALSRTNTNVFYWSLFILSFDIRTECSLSFIMMLEFAVFVEESADIFFLKDAETHYTNLLLNFRTVQKAPSKNA